MKKWGHFIKLLLGLYFVFVGVELIRVMTEQRPSDMTMKLVLAALFIVIGLGYIMWTCNLLFGNVWGKLKTAWEKRKKEAALRAQEEAARAARPAPRPQRDSAAFRTAPMPTESEIIKVTAKAKEEPEESSLKSAADETAIIDGQRAELPAEEKESSAKHRKQTVAEFFEEDIKKHEGQKAESKVSRKEDSGEISSADREQKKPKRKGQVIPESWDEATREMWMVQDGDSLQEYWYEKEPDGTQEIPVITENMGETQAIPRVSKEEQTNIKTADYKHKKENIARTEKHTADGATRVLPKLEKETDAGTNENMATRVLPKVEEETVFEEI